MHDFERYAIELMVGDGIIAPDVLRQLTHTTVSRRTRDAEACVTYFAVDPMAERIVPRDAGLAADLDVDAYGTIVASLTIAGGCLAVLTFEEPEPHWPDHPRILGLAPEP